MSATPRRCACGVRVRLGEGVARFGGRSALAVLVAVVVAGFVLRIVVGLGVVDGTGVEKFHGDARRYEKIAEDLYTEGRWATGRVPNPTDFSPGGPLLYVAVYALTGGVHREAALVAVALLQAAMIAFVYLIVRRLGRGLLQPRARVAAGLSGAAFVAFYPSYVVLSGRFVVELIAAPLFALAVLAMLRAHDRSDGSARVWWLPAFVMGLVTLTRPELMVVGGAFALMAFALGFRRAGPRTGVASLGVFIVFFLLPIVPWTVRNYVALDRVVPVTTGGGKILFEGTYLPGDGTEYGVKREFIERYPDMRAPKYRGRRVTRAEIEEAYAFPLLNRYAREKYPTMPTDSALSKLGRENFFRYLARDPLGYVAMTARKVRDMWMRGYSEAPVGGIFTPRSAGLVWYHGLVLLAALVGFVVLVVGRRRFEWMLLAAPPVAVTLIGAATLGVPRRTLTVFPILCALAGLGVAWAAASAFKRPGAAR